MNEENFETIAPLPNQIEDFTPPIEEPSWSKKLYPLDWKDTDVRVCLNL